MTTTSTSTRKPTKRDHFNTLLAIPEVSANPVLVDFITNELELLAKKASGGSSPKLSARQQENNELKDAMLGHLEDGKSCTVTDFIKNVPECAGLSQQKVSALVRQLCDDGKIERIVEKRVAYFKLID